MPDLRGLLEVRAQMREERTIQEAIDFSGRALSHIFNRLVEIGQPLLADELRARVSRRSRVTSEHRGPGDSTDHEYYPDHAFQEAR
jgi:hypothetical protein